MLLVGFVGRLLQNKQIREYLCICIASQWGPEMNKLLEMDPTNSYGIRVLGRANPTLKGILKTSAGSADIGGLDRRRPKGNNIVNTCVFL